MASQLSLNRSLRFGSVCLRTFSSSVLSTNFDVAVVGGGIVGLATARLLSISYPKLNLCLIEKEPHLGYHQTGHNSGVIHTGIYYKPGSLKARLCVEGLSKSYEYLDEKRIPYKRCGKLIVAVEDYELPALEDLYSRAVQNKVPGVTLVNGSDITSIEPACRGLKAIYSPNTGIVDWKSVAESFAKDFTANGGRIMNGLMVDKIVENSASSFPISLVCKHNPPNYSAYIQCRYLITCCGLQSDRVAVMSGCSSEPKIVPFRGEYLILKPTSPLCKISTNIYPVPDPRFPFLGVHFTPRLDGSVWLGPNATLAFHREGYKNAINFSLKDSLNFAFFPGLYRLASQYFTFGFQEFYRSFFISQQVKLLRRYIPELKASDVKRGPSGIRAQALDRMGTLVDDFIFDSGTSTLGKHILHVRNAPSPGATSSMAIAKMVCEKAATQFNLPTSK